MKALILTVFFVLELAALVAFGYWGYQLRSAELFRILLAVAAPLAVAILWGLFLSPKASVPIFTYPVRTALKLVVFLVASAALFVTGHDKLGTVFLVVSIAIVGAVFIMKWHKVNN